MLRTLHHLLQKTICFPYNCLRNVWYLLHKGASIKKKFSFLQWIDILFPVNKGCYWLLRPACFRDITIYILFFIFVYLWSVLVLFVNHFILLDNLSDFDFFIFIEPYQVVAINVAIQQRFYSLLHRLYLFHCEHHRRSDSTVCVMIVWKVDFSLLQTLLVMSLGERSSLLLAPLLPLPLALTSAYHVSWSW